MHMLMNNLGPDVTKKPEKPILYGGTDKATRSRECLRKISSTLKRLENDEALLIQSDKAVQIYRAHEERCAC